MSIKTNNAMAALLRTTDVPEDVAERLTSQPTPANKLATPEPERRSKVEKPQAKRPKPAAKASRGMDVGMTDVNRGEGVKQFTLRMPVTMWARLKLLAIRAQLSGDGAKSQQEMILTAVESYLDDHGAGLEQGEYAAAA